MYERKSYICEHFDKHRPTKKRAYLSKNAAREHESVCFYNPKRKTCFTCRHNDYSFKGNVCMIGKNENYNREIEFCKERSISNLDNRYSSLPKSMQIMFRCDYWVDGFDFNESEESE